MPRNTAEELQNTKQSDVSTAEMELKIQWINNYKVMRENLQSRVQCCTKLLFRNKSKIKYI